MSNNDSATPHMRRLVRIVLGVARVARWAKRVANRARFTSTGYLGRRRECFVYINGLHFSLGLHWSPTAGNVEVHLPCCLVRVGRRDDVSAARGPFGWVFLRYYREDAPWVHAETGDGARVQGLAMLAEPGNHDGVRLVLFAMDGEEFVRATTPERFFSQFVAIKRPKPIRDLPK